MEFTAAVIDLTEDLDIGTLRSWEEVKHKGGYVLTYAKEGFALGNATPIEGLQKTDMSEPIYSNRLGRHIYLLISRNGKLSPLLTSKIVEGMQKQIRDKDTVIISLRSQNALLSKEIADLRKNMNQTIADALAVSTNGKKTDDKKPMEDDD